MIYLRARFMKTSWLIKNATILDRNSTFNGQSVDLHIHQGMIVDVGPNLNPSSRVKIIDEPDVYVTPGWFDLRSSAPDPGNELRESIAALQESARIGGYTSVLYMATGVSADCVSVLRYILSASSSSGVKLFPAAAYSEGRKGKQMTEMYDLQREGAVAFSDFNHLASSELLSRVMEYGRDLNAPIFLFPMEEFAGGQIHEGLTSVATGLKGIPHWIETVAVQRIISLSKYYDTPVHLELISCAESVELVRAAKKSGVKISCGVSPMHLYFTDASLNTFDSNLKVLPPLRSHEDSKALLKGLRDGTIDVVVSDHSPVDVEQKLCEFDLAEWGAIQLQHSFLTALNACSKSLPIVDFCEKFSCDPYRIIGIKAPVIEKNTPALISCFSTSGETVISKDQIASVARNTPLIGTSLKGRVFPILD